MDIKLIKQLQKSPYRFFLAITGGGQSFIGDFCKVPGASSVLVGAIVPYKQTMFDDFIGGRCDSYASSEGARKLAVASYMQCLKNGIDKDYAIGLGASSSIAKNYERVGRKHKIFISIHTKCATSLLSVELIQGRSREQEDSIISDMILKCLVSFINDGNIEIKTDNKEGKWSFQEEENPIATLLLNNHLFFSFSSYKPEINSIVLYGGSFNPIHEGHRYIKNMSENLLQKDVYLEISLTNADKGILDYIEIQNRISTLNQNKCKFVLTNAPTIKEKVDLFSKDFKEITFILGSDTWNRVWNPKYGYSPEYLQEFFKEKHVKFLVFVREGFPMDKKYGQDLVISYVENPFNLSSSDLRKELIEKD